MVHAEMDAIINCGRTNNSTQDAKLYVTTFPCHNCAKHIIAAGIKEVIFVEPYPKSKALVFHNDSISMESEPNKVRFKLFVGVGPRSFLNLFSMTLGSEVELRRKDSKGDIIQWNAKTATLRTPANVLASKSIEEMAANSVKKIRDQ